MIFNLFIGIVINSMEDARQEETARRNRETGHADLGARLHAVQAELAQIAHEFEAPGPGTPAREAGEDPPTSLSGIGHDAPVGEFEGIYRSGDSAKRREEVRERLRAGMNERKIADDLGIPRHSVAEIVERLRAEEQGADPAD